MRRLGESQSEVSTKGNPALTDQAAIVDAFNRGAYDEAVGLARRMIQDYPYHPFAWKALGMILKESGRVVDALMPMETSAKLAPTDAEALNNLGGVLCELGRYDPARALLWRAISLSPQHFAPYLNAGLVESGLGRLGHAHVALHRSIVLDQANADAHNQAGLIRQQLGRPYDAVLSFKMATIVDPTRSAPYSNRGLVLIDLGRPVEAVAAQRLAVAAAPQLAEARNNLGSALKGEGLIAEAETLFRTAILLRPDFSEAYNNLGDTNQNLGALAEARSNFERALTLRPAFPECHANLQALKTYQSDDPHVEIMRRLHEGHLKDKDRIYVCFALAKACEDLKDFDMAFDLYQEGNRLRKAELGYRIDAELKLFDRLQSDFETLPEVPPVPLGGTVPILIVGMPRSGTSLVEQIFASHSDVYGGGELEILTGLVAQRYLNVPATALAEISQKITSDYVDRLRRIGQGLPFITDKMPINFWWLGFLLLSHPNLKIVHNVRDPRAVCWSNFKRYFPAKGLGFVYDLADLAEYYRLYEQLMRFWHEKFPGRIYDLHYERLTESQEDETRKVLDYCGLEWQDRCLEFEKTERPVRTASAAQVRSKIYKGSSEAWRRFGSHLEPLLQGLGLTADQEWRGVLPR